MAFNGNQLTRLLGLEVPVVQGPMGAVAGPELVAAVSNAGGLGMLPVWHQPLESSRRDIRAARLLTDRPFGVNLRADLVQTELMAMAIDEGVGIVHLFWGDPLASMRAVDAPGVHMVATVWDEDSAKAALDAGCGVLIAQGVEAGGHVMSEIPLVELLDVVFAVADDVPVVAAGGITDAEDVVRAMQRGAAGVLAGTRFVASDESFAHDEYKRALIEAGPDATVRSELFDIGWEHAPHRNLRNATVAAWEAAGAPAPGIRPGEGETVYRWNDQEIPRYSVMPPLRGMQGDLRAGVLYAGTGVGKVHDVRPAGEIVRELASRL
ncbi:MAG: NAD(P)H-dependent flavin oxidoreductase [Pseudomonadales bacterium]